MKKFLLCALVFLNAAFLHSMDVHAAENVAEINGTQYANLSDAITHAQDGETVTLISDVTENVVLDKNIVIDGNNQYSITTQGSSTIGNGTFQNITLKPENAASKLYFGNNTEKTNILLDNVTVNYDVTTREYYTYTLNNNRAAINFNNTSFVNAPNNQGILENAPEWSYGIYINGQNNEGIIHFTTCTFDGAFRTMLSSASGQVTVSGCNFQNSVYSVANGPTSGSQAEATCITTSQAANNNLTVLNNTFHNAGAIYLQTQIDFRDNHIIADGIMHYIQAKGSIGEAVDFSQNTFETGNNNYVIFDTPGAKVIMPAGMKVIDGWVWNDTPTEVRPADYTDYLYMYNEDESITYTPQSDVALEQFLTQTAGNKQVTNNDVVLIEKDLNIGNIEIAEDRTIRFQVEPDATLGISENVDLKGEIDIVGNGSLKINEGVNITIHDTGKLNMDFQTIFENNGTIDNSGSILVPDHIEGSGTITNTNSGSTNTFPTITAHDLTFKLNDHFDPLKDVTASDKEDGDTLKIEVISNTVDTSKIGTYEVTYKVTDSQGAFVTKTITVTVDKGTSSILITTKTLDKDYDGNTVNNPEYTISGSDGAVTFNWQQNIGAANTPNWVDLEQAPVNAGNYKVILTLSGNENYESASTELMFTISKAYPAPDTPKGLVITKGSEIRTITLPKGFTWKDGSMIADEPGYHSFKAIYTPENTDNYNTIELDIELHVVSESEVINNVPTINANDVTLTVGNKFDVLKDVTAVDKEDGDITQNIKVIQNTVDTSKSGTYKVTYEVTDSSGASVNKTIKVTVNTKNTVTPTPPNNVTNPDNVNNANKVPVTGDSANLYLYAFLLVISGGMLSVSGIRKIKKS